MNKIVLLTLAFIGGVSLAMQGGLNAKLGVLLRNPFLASIVAFTCSTCFAVLTTLVANRNIPSSVELKQIPTYLWFSGGLFSVLGITLYYYTIPKLGVSTMISMGLSGQLIFAVIAGHYGWLGLPVEPVSLKRFLGIVSMIFGILLINSK
ncbi:DMT family transporter [Reichenbachiella versicolor]|uniref:DMT family transporter n=1 Tax=Reichenbachiella versicolor TaxID=1821036 RepID=UPI000D6E244D|nr:DMT family transporter [Reichenbachiella versicolor]